MKHKPEAITPLFCAALLIFGTPGSGAQSADNTLKGPPAAVKSSFEAVAARLDPNGHLYAYLSTEQALAKLDEGPSKALSQWPRTGTEAVGRRPNGQPVRGADRRGRAGCRRACLPEEWRRRNQRRRHEQPRVGGGPLAQQDVRAPSTGQGQWPDLGHVRRATAHAGGTLTGSGKHGSPGTQ